MKNVLIVGLGEIGSSLCKVFEDSKEFKLFKKDMEELEIKEDIDVMHVCIPYSDKFESIVIDYIKKYNPGLVIINSTLRPGTTENIYKISKCKIVHSPVRGKHPDIYEGLMKAVKFIGGVDDESANEAKGHFESLGIKTEVLKSPMETELGKLFSTTYYGLCIAFHQEMERICNMFGADFEQTVTRFNETYNDVVRKINPKVVRPVLFPGFIGGHCVMPNITILKKDVDSDFLDTIERSNEKKKKDIKK